MTRASGAAVHRDIRQIAENIALSANAKADVEIIELYDPLVNNERVTARVLPVLERAADGDVALNERSGASEDFSFMLNDVPGLGRRGVADCVHAVSRSHHEHVHVPAAGSDLVGLLVRPGTSPRSVVVPFTAMRGSAERRVLHLICIPAKTGRAVTAGALI